MDSLKSLLAANGKLLKLLQKIRERTGSRATDMDIYNTASTRPASGMGLLINRIHSAARDLPPTARRVVDLRVAEIVEPLSPGDVADPAGGVTMGMQSHLAAAKLRYRPRLPT